MPGNCLTCFTSRFKSRSPPTLFDETISRTTSNLRAVDEVDAANPLSPALETPSTGPVVQHAEEGTESPHFETVPQPPTSSLPLVSSVPQAHPRSLAPEIVPAASLFSTLDGSGEYNGDCPIPLPAIAELPEPLPAAATEGGVTGPYLTSSFVMSPPPTPPLPPPPPVPPAHPRPPVPEIVPAASLFSTLDGSDEYNETGANSLAAIIEASESLSFKKTKVSIRGGYLPSPKELHSPYPSSQSSSFYPRLPSNICNCFMCRQRCERSGLLSRNVHECVGVEMECRPYQLDDLTPVLRFKAPPVPNTALIINSTLNFQGFDPITTENRGSMNAMIQSPDAGRFPSPHCAGTCVMMKQLTLYLLGNAANCACNQCGLKHSKQDIYARDLNRCSNLIVKRERDRGHALIASPSQPSSAPSILASSIYDCSRCRQSFESYGILRRHVEQCVGPEMADSPFECYKCRQTYDRDGLLSLHVKNCFGYGGASLNANYFRSQPNTARMIGNMGLKQGEDMEMGMDGKGKTTPVRTIVLPKTVDLVYEPKSKRREHEKKRRRHAISSSAGSAIWPQTSSLANIPLPSNPFRQASSFLPAFARGNLVISSSQPGSSFRPSKRAFAARVVTAEAFYQEQPNSSSVAVFTGLDKGPFRRERRRQPYYGNKLNLLVSEMLSRYPTFYPHILPLAVLRG